MGKPISTLPISSGTSEFRDAQLVPLVHDPREIMEHDDVRLIPSEPFFFFFTIL